MVVCECCDMDENLEVEENIDEENCAKMDESTEQLDKLDKQEKQEKEKASPIVRAGWFGKGCLFFLI